MGDVEEAIHKLSCLDDSWMVYNIQAKDYVGNLY